MATISLSFFPSPSSPRPFTYSSPAAPSFPVFNQPSSFHSSVCTPLPRRKNKQRSFAGRGDLLGDFGARDPFPAEIASNFGDRVLGNVDTEHKILIPNISALSLAQQECVPVSPSQPPMSEYDAKKLLLKVVGWRLVDSDTGLRLQCLWKTRDLDCGAELINRINKVVQDVGHSPILHLEHPSQVRAELWTASIGGLSMNDFIVAAKIDGIKTSDLFPKKRVWA